MQNIGRYRIEAELGRGAMGIVHRAVDTIIGRPVAIKTIRLDAFTDPAERELLKERLLREARSAGLLSHPNIVTVYDAGQEGGTAYIAMEFVAGRTIEQIVREEGRLERERILAVIAQVAGALDYAHGKGVVHRDIKPGNIMLTAADGGAKITDFGVAKLISHQATQSDMMLGTPNYMAPEQIDSRNVGGRTDQFALAVIAYELLTGERPFSGESLSALLYKIVREDPAPAHLLNPTLNEGVSAVMLRSFRKQPAGRFDSCSAMAKALAESLSACPQWQPLERAAAATLATVVQPAEPAVEAPKFTRARAEQAPRRRRPWLLAAVPLAAAAAWVMMPVPPAPIPVAPPPAVIDATRPSPLSEPVVKPPEPEPEPAKTETVAVAPPPVAPPKPAVPSGPVSGVVEIASTPPGATVRIDNTQDSCKAPCSMELSQGRHVLHFKLDGHREGIVIITVPQESNASMRMDPLIGTLMVNTTPSGSQILVNGQLQKDLSPLTLRLAPGKYRLTLRREGARDRTQEVEVHDSTISHLDYTWN